MKKGKMIEIVLDHFEMHEFKRSFIRKMGDEYVCDGGFIVNAPDECISVNFNNMKHTYDIFSLMGSLWGNWNDCPSWRIMKEKAKEWNNCYAAEVRQIAHDAVVFQCTRQLSDSEIEELLSDISKFAPNSLDIADYEAIKKNIAEEGKFTLWWD